MRHFWWFSNNVGHQQFKRSFSNAETSCLPIKLSPKHFEALVTTWISWKNDFKSGQRFSHQIFRNCSFRYHFVKVKFRIRFTYLVLISGLTDQYADGKAAKVWQLYIGDTVDRTTNYKDFLIKTLKSKNCKRVLDAACGTG